MKYAKLIEGFLYFAPKNKNGICNYNLDVERLAADGYKEFVEAEKTNGYTYKISYLEDEKQIVELAQAIKTPEDNQKEAIQNLTCTKRVFALCLKNFGVSYQQLKEKIAENIDAQLEWDLCVELKRDNPLIDLTASELGITSEQIDNIFKYANGLITEGE